MNFNIFSKQNGQVLLVVILVMVVSLTLGLSVASKSIVNFKNSVEEAESQKALHAAEAGIEKAIQSSAQGQVSGSFESGTFATEIKDTKLPSLLLNAGNPVKEDEGIDVWLKDYPNFTSPTGGEVTSFTVYWGGADCESSALEIILLSGDKNSPAIKRYTYDPCASRRSSNNFSVPNSSSHTFDSTTLSYSTALINIASGDGLVARIIPIYKDAVIGVIATPSLPSQGKIFSSVGTSGNAQRRVNVFQGFPSIPGEFFYSIFSPAQ
jgi:hypothetical protein